MAHYKPTCYVFSYQAQAIDMFFILEEVELLFWQPRNNSYCY